MKSLLQQLTIQEKMKLTSGNSNWTFLGIERLHIPELMCADGPHGLRAYKENPRHGGISNPHELAPTTLFPVAAAMAATFNKDLIYSVGKAIGEECNHHDVDLLLAPGINMKRSPLGGRNFEYYSEDPFLTSVCGTAFVNGVQSTGVGATIKHFALNEQENQRRFIDTEIDERTKFEFYLRPFQYIIEKANPFAIMSSYNKIDGDYASENKELLINILRNKWNYDGMVISDWGAVQNKVKSITTGMNLEMPGPCEFHHELEEAVENKTLSETDLDNSLKPLFRLYERTVENQNKGKKADYHAHHKLAHDVASEAIVLLENDGILPLSKGQKLGVIGTFAKHPRINGGGSATTKPHTLENPLEELSNVYDVTYAPGYEEEHTTDKLLQEVKILCDGSDTILFFTGTTEKLETEGKDREHMNIPDGHIDVFNVIRESGKKVVVVLNNGSSVNVTPFIPHANAIVEAWLLGGANGKALVDIISGDVNPSGRLSETFPIQIEHTPHHGTFPSTLDCVSYNGDLLRNGYRYYDLHQYPVRYPFGYGLSYTTFEYGEATLSRNRFPATETVEVRLNVTNTGPVFGREVVQLYIHDKESYYPRPIKELRGFAKIALDPGQTGVVTFTLHRNDFTFYSDVVHDFIVEEGEFEILIGSNVQNIHQSVTVYVESDDQIHATLSLDHPLKNFKLYRPKKYQLIEERFGKIQWYNIEEPAIRVLKRFKRRHHLSDQEFNDWIDLLRE